MLAEVLEEELVELYAWVDSIPLSRPKKSIARDFADAVLAAEIVAYYFPRIVELHNYSPSSNSAQKVSNWTTLNHRVFKKLGFALPRHVCEAVAFGEPGVVERVLKLLRTKLAAYQVKHVASRASHLPTPNGAAGAQKFSPVKSQAQIGFVTTKGDLIPSFNATQGDAAETHIIDALRADLDESRGLVRLLEDKCGKMEALLRLKDAKIAALTARLEVAGLLDTKER